jgi:hypothetical protein
MSDLRQSDHGPGRFVVCMRGANSEFSPRRTYAVFFDNEAYKGGENVGHNRRLRKAGLPSVALEGRLSWRPLSFYQASQLMVENGGGAGVVAQD